MSASDAPKIRKRPRGVWILTICNAIFVLPIPLIEIWVVQHPGEIWNEASRITAPYFLLLSVAFYISTLGTWFGSRMARNAMVALLVIFAVAMIWESVALLLTWFSIASDFSRARMSNWWGFSVGLRWSLWLAINVRYFFGKSAQDFYRRPNSS